MFTMFWVGIVRGHPAVKMLVVAAVPLSSSSPSALVLVAGRRPFCPMSALPSCSFLVLLRIAPLIRPRQPGQMGGRRQPSSVAAPAFLVEGVALWVALQILQQCVDVLTLLHCAIFWSPARVSKLLHNCFKTC